LRYVKVWREDLRLHPVPEEVWSRSALPVVVLLSSWCNPFDLCSFGLLYVINIYVTYFVLCYRVQ
jgi:hypothetical protein